MIAMDVINLCNVLRPNAFSDQEKLDWLWTLDASLCRELARTTGMKLEKSAYTMTDTLMLEDEFCGVYETYLFSRMDFLNGEMRRYNETAALFNHACQRYLDHMSRTHAAPDVTGVRV